MTEMYYTVMPGGDKYDTRHEASGVAAIRERINFGVECAVFAVERGSELDDTVEKLSATHAEYVEKREGGGRE